jgi:hypothetical protein
VSINSARGSVEAQLAYWQEERAVAQGVSDAKRIARCEKFIVQCEVIIAALRAAHSGSPPEIKTHARSK